MLENLKALREEKGMTQEQLASMARIHRVTIARYELGEISPTLESAQRLAEALQVPIEKLSKVG